MKKKIFIGILALVMAFGACTIVSYGNYGIGMGCPAPTDKSTDTASANQESSNEAYKMWLIMESIKKNNNEEQEEANSDEIKVTVNGKKVIFDVPPQLINNCTMVPLRKIFEAIGADVLWDGETQTVTAVKGNQTVVAAINDKNAYVNGTLKILNVPPVIIEGRTLVPVRFVAAALGANVEWNSKTKTVVINT